MTSVWQGQRGPVFLQRPQTRPGCGPGVLPEALTCICYHFGHSGSCWNSVENNGQPIRTNRGGFAVLKTFPGRDLVPKRPAQPQIEPKSYLEKIQGPPKDSVKIHQPGQGGEPPAWDGGCVVSPPALRLCGSVRLGWWPPRLNVSLSIRRGQRSNEAPSSPSVKTRGPEPRRGHVPRDKPTDVRTRPVLPSISPPTPRPPP